MSQQSSLSFGRRADSKLGALKTDDMAATAVLQKAMSSKTRQKRRLKQRMVRDKERGGAHDCCGRYRAR